jgi:hypothetical protein
MMLDWVPACDGFAIVACRDAGMTKLEHRMPVAEFRTHPFTCTTNTVALS